jgi:hypothetical protein
METQRVMMIQIADPTWTLKALHCAGAMARQQSAKIVLVKMVPVQHMGWLGTDFGYLNISEQEREEIADYQSMLEDYGVEFELCLFQYATLAEALVEAAEYVNAQIVFATLPESAIPFWRSYQLLNLRRSLARSSRDWIEHPDDALTPAPAPALAIVSD